MNKKYRISQDLIFEKTNQDCILVIDMSDGKLYEINKIANDILQFIGSGKNVNDVFVLWGELHRKEVEDYVKRVIDLEWLKPTNDINDTENIDLNNFSTDYCEPKIYSFDMSNGYFSKFISRNSGFDIK